MSTPEPDWKQLYLNAVERNTRFRAGQDRKLRELRQDRSRLAAEVADLTEQVRKLTPGPAAEKAERDRKADHERLLAAYRAQADQNSELRRVISRGQRAAIEKVITTLTDSLSRYQSPAQEIPSQNDGHEPDH